MENSIKGIFLLRRDFGNNVSLENQDTKAKETILLLTIKLSNRNNNVFYKIDNFIQENKNDIIDYMNTKAQLDKIK